MFRKAVVSYLVSTMSVLTLSCVMFKNTQKNLEVITTTTKKRNDKIQVLVDTRPKCRELFLDIFVVNRKCVAFGTFTMIFLQHPVI